MDYKVLWDYSDALRRKQSALLREGSNDKADTYERYSDVIDSAVAHMRLKTSPNRDDAYAYSRVLCRLFSPGEIEDVMPEHRHSDVYKATYQLASAMERAAVGKSPRRLFGLLA